MTRHVIPGGRALHVTDGSAGKSPAAGLRPGGDLQRNGRHLGAGRGAHGGHRPSGGRFLEIS